jgi:hypothetical protein
LRAEVKISLMLRVALFFPEHGNIQMGRLWVERREFFIFIRG